MRCFGGREDEEQRRGHPRLSFYTHCSSISLSKKSSCVETDVVLREALCGVRAMWGAMATEHTALDRFCIVGPLPTFGGIDIDIGQIVSSHWLVSGRRPGRGEMVLS
jgi:hypothetical protein